MSRTRESIEQIVHTALIASVPELDDIRGDADLVGELGLDSIQVLDLVMEIEDRLDVSVPMEALADVRTLNQLTDRLMEISEPDDRAARR
jgi:acyl carrier protein